MTAISQLRDEGYARVAYILFIEGIQYAWTTEESGALLGSGASTWIGLSEQDLIDNGDGTEVVGQRTVLGGLIVPDTIAMGIDPKGGWLRGSSATFKLLDQDDTLVSLFATEGKSSDLLSEYIRASTTALGTSIQLNNLTTTTNPRGKYIGMERIGPSGQRRFFPCWPGFGMPGDEHFWNNIAPDAGGPDPVLVSSEPILWEGRRWALYRLYRDHHLDHVTGTTAAGAWPVWRLQHDGGGLVSWGVLSGHGRHTGNKVWSIEARGPESLLQKPLGIRTNMDWLDIKAVPSLATDEGAREDEVAVIFGFHHEDIGGSPDEIFGDFESSIFDSANRLTSTTLIDLRTELDTLIGEVAAGTNSNHDPGNGTLSNPNGTASANLNAAEGDAGMYVAFGDMWIKKSLSGGYFTMDLILHETVWRWLGFDIDKQNHHGPIFEDIKQIRFERLPAGYVISTYLVPGPGYVRAKVDTRQLKVALPYPITNSDESKAVNSNAPDGSENTIERLWRPEYELGMDVFRRKGRQWIGLPGSTTDIYVQGNLTLPWTAQQDPAGLNTTNRSGLFVIRGMYLAPDADEPEMRYLVCRCSWYNDAWNTAAGNDDGILGTFLDDTLTPALYVEEVFHPRLFGYDSDPLPTDWSSNPAQDSPLQIKPLSGVPYFLGNFLEYADAILTATLVSTGSGTGYDGPIAGFPSITKGSNDPGDATSDLYWHGDLFNYSMSLGIPEELVADCLAVRDAFSEMPKGITDPLNLIRIAWHGSVQAEDFLRSMTETRRLFWSLQGRKYGVFFMGPLSHEDADLTILEGSLGGTPGDPTSVIPSQEFKFTGAIDRFALKWRYDPDKGSTRNTYSGKAADAKAAHRTGKVEHSMEDWGLQEDVFVDGNAIAGGWLPSLFKLWQQDGAEFYAKAHFGVRDLKVREEDGQDCFPGTKILLTNQWLVDPSGAYGVTNHVGVLTDVSPTLKAGAPNTVCSALMLSHGAPDQMPYCAPVAKLLGYNGDEETPILYFREDFRGIADAAIHDLTGFAKPSWADGNSRFVVQFWYWDGTVDSNGLPTMTKGPTAAGSSVDTATNTITLQSAPSSTLERDWDVYVTLVAYDDQESWAQTIYGFHVLDTLKGDASETKGKAFV